MEQFQYFLKDPVKYDVKYQVRSLSPRAPLFLSLQSASTASPKTASIRPASDRQAAAILSCLTQASAQPFFVFGLLVTALATSH